MSAARDVTARTWAPGDVLQQHADGKIYGYQMLDRVTGYLRWRTTCAVCGRGFVTVSSPTPGPLSRTCIDHSGRRGQA